MKKPAEIVTDIWKSHKNYLGKVSATAETRDIQDFLASLFCPGPYLYYVLDSPTLTIEKAGGAVKQLFGVSPLELNLSTLIESVHPDDVDYFLKCEDLVAYFFKHHIEPHRTTDYKVVYCLRMLTAEGQYKLFLFQTLTLKTTPQGALLKVFGCFTDINHISATNNHKLSIIDLKDDNSCLEIDALSLEPLKGFVPYSYKRSAHLLTKRELEIIRKLGLGWSNEKIADELNISIQTVATHRKNMLKKTGMNNSLELVADCIRKGFV